MTSQDTRYQLAYLAHQEKKRKMLAGELELVEEKEDYDLMLPFSELVAKRKSQRIFNDIKIEDIELNYIKDALINTPSSCNRQAVWIKVVRKDKEQLGELLVGGSKWIAKADIILLLLADMEAYKSPAEVNFMPYLDAGFLGMTAYYASEAIGVGCCFVNPNIREENKETFNKIFNKEGYRMCGAIALGHYDKRLLGTKKNNNIFL